MIHSKIELQAIKSFKRARVDLVTTNTDIAIVTATDKYIPIEEFKEIFRFIGSEVVPKYGTKKLIFDKRELTIFHQPSMEWYFTEWKGEMYDLGLSIHRKILPNDTVFQQSVKIGREGIAKKYPNGKYKQMDVQYSESIEEAIEK